MDIKFFVIDGKCLTFLNVHKLPSCVLNLIKPIPTILQKKIVCQSMRLVALRTLKFTLSSVSYGRTPLYLELRHYSVCVHALAELANNHVGQLTHINFKN